MLQEVRMANASLKTFKSVTKELLEEVTTHTRSL